MVRRSFFAIVVVIVMLLALAAPALAGGWAVLTLDSLPREVRAGQSFQLGFMVRQHGETPTNKDLNGKPLKPVLTAHKQAAASIRSGGALLLVAAPAPAAAKGEETIRVEARQEGAVGHFVADVTFPSGGVWEWQIALPTYYVQNPSNGQEGNAAIFAPLTVLPAAAPAQAPAAAPVAQPAPATAPEVAATTFLGLSPAALRWGGVILLVVAAGVALAAQRGVVGRRRAARAQ
jgi:hypothetical protein